MINQVLPRSCIGVRRYNAFTLIELIVVVGIIVILSGLVLSTVGYARKKAARARAETEIAAMSAACENYKADNGVYPRNPTPGYTDASATPGRTAIREHTNILYESASLYLFTQLSGDRRKSYPDYSARAYIVVQTTNAVSVDTKR